MNVWRLPRRAVGWGLRRMQGLVRVGAVGTTGAPPTEASSTEPKPVIEPPVTSIDFDKVMEAKGGFLAWRRRRCAATLQFTEAAIENLDRLHEEVPGSVASCLTGADRLMEHSFSFLGAAPFVPADPDRPVWESGYVPIDWCLDPVRGQRFRNDVPHRSWDLFSMRPGNADIKYPWELGRCQHFMTLAQAYCLTGDEKFAVEIINQCTDFIEANPIGFGVQWVCTMDVALRAANWCFALCLLKECKGISEDSWSRIYRHLFETGCFILQNLENKYEVTSNHFLSNLVGLHVLAAEFSGLKFADQWDAYAREAIEAEIEAQVLDDGADYESSIPYHRLVCELFLGSMRLAQIQGKPLSDNFQTRLNSMLSFLDAVLLPGGTVPVVGDADDGRLLIISNDWEPQDARHMLAAGGSVMGRPGLVSRAGAEAYWEAFWWGCDEGLACSATVVVPADDAFESHFFADAGIIVGRSWPQKNYLLVSNGVVGTSGFGNHKHNDLLSFEYMDRGQKLVVDPGSYVYTSDFEARNSFRSTRRHSTLMIDGVEQNEIRDEYLFRVFAKAKPVHEVFDDTGSGIRYVGSHDGYLKQLTDGVIHERAFEQDSRTGTLKVSDRLSGKGIHDIDWYWQIAPGVEVEEADKCVTLQAGPHKWTLSWNDEALNVEVLKTDVSPSYGIKHPSLTLHHARAVDLGSDCRIAFRIDREAQV